MPPKLLLKELLQKEINSLTRLLPNTHRMLSGGNVLAPAEHPDVQRNVFIRVVPLHQPAGVLANLIPKPIIVLMSFTRMETKGVILQGSMSI